MNDFTKEELENISAALYAWNQDRDEFIHEYEKVHEMIESYCQNNGHAYEFSLGRGYCENCGAKE